MLNERASIYILKLKGRLSVIYYDQKEGICERQYTDGGFTRATTIADAVTSWFSLNISENGELFMFCQDTDGSIILYNYNGKEWKNRVIQENITKTVYNIHFHAVINASEIHLLYNVPNDKNYDIVSQQMIGGEWGKSTTIAEKVVDSTPVFTVQNIKPNHYIVYFQVYDRKNVLCSKEFYLPNNWGTLKPLNQTIYPYKDKSIVTTKDGIHASFILKGMYSSQLFYRNWLDGATGVPIVLFESPRLDEVALFINEGVVYVIFRNGSHGFYTAYSKDNGATFVRPTRTRIDAGNYVKAEYICDYGQNPNNMMICDMFINLDNPADIVLIKELQPDFFPVAVKSNKRPEPNAEPLSEVISEKSHQISILENKLDNAYKELADKNKQIADINSIVINQNEEISQTSNNWREITSKLKYEISERIETEKSLRVEIEGLKKRLDEAAKRKANDRGQKKADKPVVTKAAQNASEPKAAKPKERAEKTSRKSKKSAKPVTEVTAENTDSGVEVATKNAKSGVEVVAENAEPVAEVAAENAEPVTEVTAESAEPIAEVTAEGAEPVVEVTAENAEPVAEVTAENTESVVAKRTKKAKQAIEYIEELKENPPEENSETILSNANRQDYDTVDEAQYNGD